MIFVITAGAMLISFVGVWLIATTGVYSDPPSPSSSRSSSQTRVQFGIAHAIAWPLPLASAVHGHLRHQYHIPHHHHHHRHHQALPVVQGWGIYPVVGVRCVWRRPAERGRSRRRRGPSAISWNPDTGSVHSLPQLPLAAYVVPGRAGY